MPRRATDHPGSDELLAYGDEAADPRSAEHIRGCAACQDQAAALIQTQAALRRSLYRIDCPDAHTLGEYQLEGLDPVRRQTIAAHAAACEACSAELQTLRGYLAVEPPPMPETFSDRARRVVASLLAPAPGLAFGGLRGSAEASVRVYAADELMVSIGSGDAPGSLIGLVMTPQALAEDVLGSRVRLVASNGVEQRSTLDELGHFEFSALATDVYTLEIEVRDTLVVIDPLPTA